jgi:hypothetical protein
MCFPYSRVDNPHTASGESLLASRLSPHEAAAYGRACGEERVLRQAY